MPNSYETQELRVTASNLPGSYTQDGHFWNIIREKADASRKYDKDFNIVTEKRVDADEAAGFIFDVESRLMDFYSSQEEFRKGGQGRTLSDTYQKIMALNLRKPVMNCQLNKEELIDFLKLITVFQDTSPEDAARMRATKAMKPEEFDDLEEFSRYLVNSNQTAINQIEKFPESRPSAETGPCMPK